ncbi:MAG: hypothetical protein LQ343_001348 [Gyalolechia ehrenbergii]|nr:MAG: hypothetical protein LQ343_001348 [Gyalolechia ehrenbergii]
MTTWVSTDLNLNRRDFYEENRWQKFGRKLKEEPLIPLGCAATSWALLSAAKSIRSGNSYRAQQMFRMRLYAQAFTIAAMIAGSLYYNKDRILRKQYDDLMRERKAQEKRNAWIKELEARDREEKDWREKLKAVTEKREQEARDRREREEELVREGGPLTRAAKEIKRKIQQE